MFIFFLLHHWGPLWVSRDPRFLKSRLPERQAPPPSFGKEPQQSPRPLSNLCCDIRTDGCSFPSMFLKLLGSQHTIIYGSGSVSRAAVRGVVSNQEPSPRRCNHGRPGNTLPPRPGWLHTSRHQKDFCLKTVLVSLTVQCVPGAIPFPPLLLVCNEENKLSSGNACRCGWSFRKKHVSSTARPSVVAILRFFMVFM